MIDLPQPFAFPLHPPALSGAVPRLGSYELLEELAVGRSFRLDLALAPSGVAVALKRLRGESAHTRARLEREARVASSLSAPNLLRVFEYLEQPEPTVVFDYVRGATLRQLLATAQPSDLRHAVTAYVGALRGLAALHAFQDGGFVVHQAPVARHVLVGTDGVARLTDLSHAAGAPLGECEGSEQGLVLSELAPEQIRGEPLDPRSDVFIAGATLRDLIARCRVTERTPLDEVWQRATRERRDQRYLSAHELAYALGRAAQRAGLLARPEEQAAWVHARLQDQRPSGARPPPLPRRSSSPPAAWSESASAERFDAPHERAVSFVPPRVSLPRVRPSAERMSSVWYSVVAKPTDDDVVRAIAAAKPLRPQPSRRWRRVDLRGLGGGMTLGGLTLCGLIAMGAASEPERLPLRANLAMPSESAELAARAQLPPAPPPVPAVTQLVPMHPTQPVAVLAEPQAEPTRQRERSAHPRRERPAGRRELIRMTGSVPENPY